MDQSPRDGGMSSDYITLLPPKPGTCPTCAAYHKPDQPHNRDSLYYQMKFRRKYGRYPTWADAMAHCEKYIQKIWIDNLAERGVIVELPEETADGDTE